MIIASVAVRKSRRAPITASSDSNTASIPNGFPHYNKGISYDRVLGDGSETGESPGHLVLITKCLIVPVDWCSGTPPQGCLPAKPRAHAVEDGDRHPRALACLSRNAKSNLPFICSWKNEVSRVCLKSSKCQPYLT